MRNIILTAATLAICTMAIALPASAKDFIGKTATSEIINNDGKVIGQALFTQGAEGVLITIEAKSLPSGKHGLHLHEVGTCHDHAEFKESKGHIMPDGAPHGFLNTEAAPHAGDLPNLIVHKDGTVNVELYINSVSLNGHDHKPAILDQDGSVLMIHADADDHKTQPIGGAGARIACGVIK